MKYLNKFNESVERDIRDAIDNILLWLKEDDLITYTISDSTKSRIVPKYIKGPLKRVVISIQSIDKRRVFLRKDDIKDYIETILDFIRSKWGNEITIKYSSDDEQNKLKAAMADRNGVYYDLRDDIPFKFKNLSILIEKWK